MVRLSRHCERRTDEDEEDGLSIPGCISLPKFIHVHIKYMNYEWWPSPVWIGQMGWQTMLFSEKKKKNCGKNDWDRMGCHYCYITLPNGRAIVHARAHVDMWILSSDFYCWPCCRPSPASSLSSSLDCSVDCTCRVHVRSFSLLLLCSLFSIFCPCLPASPWLLLPCSVDGRSLSLPPFLSIHNTDTHTHTYRQANMNNLTLLCEHSNAHTHIYHLSIGWLF